jgi:hypothetical protein
MPVAYGLCTVLGTSVLLRAAHVSFLVFMFNVLGTNWGPTDRFLFMQIQLVRILLLWEKQLLMEPPHAFGSNLAKKSGTEEVC